MRPIIFPLLLLVLFSNTVDADSFIKDQATLKSTVHAIDQNALSNNHWYQQGDDWLRDRVKSFQIQSHSVDNSAAKNIILFIGDGMSITTLTAARIWQGQQQGKLGEEHFLHFETFPHTALIKTYNSNQQTPDSAGTMSAIMTGVKTRAGIISMGPEQDNTDCKGSTQHHQQTLLEWGHKQGFATGIVTTARLTHATPAATYAHSPDRRWEGDYDRHPNAYWYGCDSIAKQLVEGAFPAGLDLALGGGGSRLQSYYESFHQQFPFGHLLNNQKELLKWDAVNEQPSQSGPVLGVFSSGHMDFESDRTDKQPSLKVMTKMALKYLQGLDNKYLLVIESARIDHAHHNGNAARALAETAMLADSVQLADDMTRDDDTLIIVTADHSHTFVMAGYPKRGNPILGVSKNQQDELVLANDGLPYTSLGYANGSSSGRAKNPQHFAATEDKNFHQEVAVALEAETHGSDDVALHAKGPGAYLFSGLMEQNEIFHTMLQALSSGDIKVEESK